MAAGLGFKDFTTGEVLTAADVDGYLMQGIWVFASTAARDAAVTAPAEGNFAFTKDTNSLWYYDGAAWVASGATGDIEGVTAGVGISGGGTSGTVTVTNSMATAITTAGDTLYGTGSGTFSRLGIGTAGQVLKVNSGATAPEWGAAGATSGLTKITSNLAFSGSTTVSVNNCFTSTYTDYLIILSNLATSTATTVLSMRFRVSGSDNTTSNYTYGNQPVNWSSGGTSAEKNIGGTDLRIIGNVGSSTNKASMVFYVNNPQATAITTWQGSGNNDDATYRIGGQFTATTSFDGFSLLGTQNLSGNLTVYGYEK